MTDRVPQIVLVRHAETAWSATGQHTGTTDLPLTSEGERKGMLLRRALGGFDFERVFTSPLRRAVRTSELAGFGDVAVQRDELVEWNYGEYEGRTTAEIRERRPDWSLWVHGAPGGESPEQVRARIDPLVEELTHFTRDVALFAHGHISRAIGVRWAGLPIEAGRALNYGTGAISVLSWHRGERVIERWNDDTHLRSAG